MTTQEQAERARDSEQRVLSRTRWSISLRIAVVMSAVIAFLGVAIYLVMLAEQNRDISHELYYAADLTPANASPGCVWVTVEHQGALTSSVGMPPGLPQEASINRVAGGQPAIRQDVDANGSDYVVVTQRRGADVLQIVIEREFQVDDRDDLLLALGLAELIGLIAAVISGGALAKRAMSPLCESMNRQRRFVADASHELRTPLTQLHTRTQLLLRRADRGELTERELADELNRIVAGTRQLGDVVDDLLLSTQLGALPTPWDTVDLGEVALAAVEAESARAQVTGLVLDMQVTEAEHLVTGAASALRRVVSALLDNAIGHTPVGGRITVTVDRADAGTVRLTVRDTGVGFDPADAELLFARFARGTSGRGRRFGLGLALAREVVDNHHGSISADSRPGGGATFTVLLPAAGGRAAASAAEAVGAVGADVVEPEPAGTGPV
ncbi:MAG TPA: HAMP domain-containing sensor histidine kinase [Pseudonocardiaceae bacterium]|nr:HAMP domain-containing sensor histidine kinase [Pseudonocardiaceae bacterium]